LDADEKCTGITVTDLRKEVNDRGIQFERSTNIVEKSRLCNAVKNSMVVDNLKNILFGGKCDNVNKMELLRVAREIGLDLNSNGTAKDLCLELQREYFTRYYWSRGEKFGLSKKDIMDFLEGKGNGKKNKELANTFSNAFRDLEGNPQDLNARLEYFRNEIWPIMLNEPLLDLNKSYERPLPRLSPVRNIAPVTLSPRQIQQQLEQLEQEMNVPTPDINM